MVDPSDVNAVSFAARADAEVDEVGKVVVGQQNVGRLDIAVHQPGSMGAAQCRRDLLDGVDRAFGL
jgi:hypothetical protein